MVEDGWEPVKVITADSTTDEEPFAVRKAGSGKNPSSLIYTASIVSVHLIA
jgi:hypothetical protein